MRSAGRRLHSWEAPAELDRCVDDITPTRVPAPVMLQYESETIFCVPDLDGIAPGLGLDPA